MHRKAYKRIELITLFVIIPLIFLFEFSVFIKIGIGLIGFLYIVFVLLRVEKLKFILSPDIRWSKFFKTLIIKLIIIAIVTSIYQYLFDASQLFLVLSTKPLLWITILFVYSAFSVYPQELIYRTFFFQRYEMFFSKQRNVILVNALLFSLGHVFFRNSLVLFITFIGGIVFAFTYYNTRSTLLVSIEHAVYGCWLFTIGMGPMLGFPS